MHKKTACKTLIIQLITVGVIVLLDQLIKLWIVDNVAYHDGFSLVRGIIGIFHETNTGAGWSILEGQTFLLIVAPLLAVAAMLYVLIARKIKSKAGTWAISLILAGAIGNLIDRVFRAGEVVDMFKFEFIKFPIFNIADVAITIGAVLFFVYILFFYEDKAENKNGKDLPDGRKE